MKKPPSKTAARPATKKSARAVAAKSVALDPSTEGTQPAPRKNILTAGIKALTNAHEEAVARQSRVFESLLGLGQRRDPGAAVEPPPALDPFGFKKFEDVFDQRVARALQHLGVPTADTVAELKAEVQRLRETVAKLEAQRKR